jgi:hypothetical protein
MSLIRLSAVFCENDSCIHTICRVYRPCHYKITLLQESFANGSYSSVVEILTTLALWH